MFKWNIRNQIMGAGLVSLLVLLGVMAFFYAFSRDELRSHSANLIGMTNARYGEDIEEVIKAHSQQFLDWTRNNAMGAAIEMETTHELESRFQNWIQHSSGFSMIVLVDHDGYVVQCAGSPEQESVTALNGERLHELRNIESVLMPDVRLLESETLSRLGRSDSRSYMYYQPTFNSSGHHNGAFVAFTDWSAIDLITDLCASDLRGLGFASARCALVDRASHKVLSGTGAGVGFDTELASGYASGVDLADFGDVRLVELGDVMMSVGAFYVELPSIGESGVDKDRGPFMLSAVPQKEIVASLFDQLTTILSIGMLATLTVLGFTLFVAGRISRRINFVADFAREMATGDISRTINTRSEDEVGVLARAFNDLSAYMREMADAAERIANNDLTVRIEPRSDQDVLGNSFRAMVIKLSSMVLRMTASAEQLFAAASSIASASRDIQSGVVNQAGQITQVSTAIEEMAATITESARNAGEANNASRDAAETANQGGSVVGNAIQKMERITDVVRSSAQSIAELARSADQIGEIARVIDDIADQTNLLALNAAIEAARAGEQGRGFAVVADEVRKLAERTGTATAEIASMIKEIQRQTEKAVNSMEAGVQEVDTGREMVDKAGESLINIVAVSERVMSMIHQIATASEEQSVAAEEISRNVENISGVTETTARGAEQFARAASELTEQSAGLNAIVSQFVVAEKSRSN